MKAMLISLLCTVAMFGLVLGMGDAPSSGEDEAYICFVATHCELGDDVLKDVLASYDHLDDEEIQMIYGWASEKGEDVAAENMAGSSEIFCLIEEERRKSLFQHLAQNVVNTLNEECSKDDNPACDRWTGFADTLRDVLGDQKDNENC